MLAEQAVWHWYKSIGVDAIVRESLARAASPVSASAAPVPSVIERPADSLAGLRAQLEQLDIPLRHGASRLVFADGAPEAPVMLIGEAPGHEEDRLGKPFVGASGQLLDRMLAALGWSRTRDVYITNIIPWRPPQNRTPTPSEIAVLQPYLAEHITLVKPKVIGFLGGVAAKALLETSTGILRLRGTWHDYQGIPCLPMLHPAFLLRSPEQKRLAWRDWLDLKAKLDSLHA